MPESPDLPSYSNSPITVFLFCINGDVIIQRAKFVQASKERWATQALQKTQRLCTRHPARKTNPNLDIDPR